MKKLGVTIVLAGLFVVGCGDNGLVKLENKNPTIDQKNYDLYMKKLQESEFKGGGHNFEKTIKTSEYDFYHSDSMLKYAPIREMAKKKKEKCKKNNIPDDWCANIELQITHKTDKDELKEKGNLEVFAVNKKNPKDFYRILLTCYFTTGGKCENIDDVRAFIYNIQDF